MSFSATLNGTIGHTSSAFARQVVATLGTASAECSGDFYQKWVIRKDSLEIPKPPDTPLPITVTLPFTDIKFLAIRTVNVAQISLHYDEQVPVPDTDPIEYTTVAHVIPVSLGFSDHPEGLFVLFGGPPNLSLTIDSVGTDKTQIEIWSAGDQ